MNSHQRRKVRRQHQRKYPWAFTPYQVDAIKKLFASTTGPTIAELQRDGHLPATNQAKHD